MPIAASYGEFCSASTNSTGIDFTVRAGEMFARYRSKGGKRTRMVPDFLIGAHAMLQCDALITRDGGFYRDYFKDLKIINPKASA